MLGSQAVSRRLDDFQHCWAEELLQDDAGAASGTERRLRLIYAFLGSLNEIVEAETANWEAEFRSSIAHMHDTSPAREQQAGHP